MPTSLPFSWLVFCSLFSLRLYRNKSMEKHSIRSCGHWQNIWIRVGRQKPKGEWYLLISQVGPVHPVAHVQVNSLTGGVGDNIDDIFALLLNKTLLDSLVGRTLTGLPIELIPRIPRRTTTAVVCSSVLSPSFRPLPSYFVGFCGETDTQSEIEREKKTNH